MELQLIDDGYVFALRSDFDAAYESISPGSYLNRHMLARLFGTGLRRYLMGPGENIYKYRWADHSEAVSTMTIYGHSMRGRWLAARELALKPAARRVRDLFRPPRSRKTPEASNPDDAT
jgi:CelD/BcsL family acetyltransferase involved in cellulose biosynthesis